MASVAELRRIMPDMPTEKADVWAKKLAIACAAYGIVTPLREAMFLAQIAHESRELNDLEENLRYTSASRIQSVWSSRFPSIVSATPYVRNPEKLANKVYAGRNGNGSEASGDGWRYRGRGIIQTTGKANYIATARGIGYPVDSNPDLLLEIGVSSFAAAWYCLDRGVNGFADEKDVVGATRVVNGKALRGLEERRAYYKRAMEVLGAA